MGGSTPCAADGRDTVAWARLWPSTLVVCGPLVALAVFYLVPMFAIVVTSLQSIAVFTLSIGLPSAR